MLTETTTALSTKVESKECISCKVAKPKTPDHFYFRNKGRGWLSSWCKECRSAHRTLTKDRENEAQRLRRGYTTCKTCSATDKPKGNTYCATCLQEIKRKSKRVEKAVHRKRLKEATPKWADRSLLRLIKECRPAGCDVDHIIPLRGELVSGLNVPENLRYLPQAVNLKKSNHYSLENESRK